MMFDIAMQLPDRPGALADMGEALAGAGVSIEGGGAWVTGGIGSAHFLVQDGATARSALEAAGIHVLNVREVVTLRLDQERPGQLGALCRRMAAAGVNIEALYSDHEHRLVLVVDALASAQTVAEEWARVR